MSIIRSVDGRTINRMKNNTIKRIAKMAEKYLENYENVGVRVQEDLFGMKVGTIATHKSSHWDDGVMLDDEIDGICAVDVELAPHLDKWGGTMEGLLSF
jgi:hypothetical protein